MSLSTDTNETPGASEDGALRGERAPALDGLRGIAVILVVLFHLRVRGFAAGYLGVDVFFVLSGFLITGLLLAELHRTGGISLVAFWARRARRLLPGLVLLLIVVAIVTHLTATYSERTSIRGDLLATAGYVANWRLISTTSYFVNTGTASPLQHTWSLAIEEQFYLLWPLLLVCAALIVRGRPGTTTVTLAVLGIGASVGITWALYASGAADRAYMGTDSRIFEPLVGAVGAWLVADERRRRRIAAGTRPLGVVGVAGVVAGLVLLGPDSSVYYQGGALLFSLACLALVLAVWVASRGPLVGALRWPPLVGLGLISYGVYLWHWPIIVWLGLEDARGVAAVVRGAAAVALTLVAALVSYVVVERPVRRGRKQPRHAPVKPGLRPAVVLAAVPVSLLSVAALALAATSVPAPSSGTPVVMLAGDSVPLHLTPTLEHAASSRGWQVVSAARGACPVTGEVTLAPDGDPTLLGPSCPAVTALQDSLIATWDPRVVVWWDRWSLSSYEAPGGTAVVSGTPSFWRARTEALDRAVDRLSSDGATVLLVTVEPEGQAVSSTCSEGCGWWTIFRIQHYEDITARWNHILTRYSEEHADTTALLSVTDSVCQSDVSPCTDDIDGVPARPDGTHYAGVGADLVASLLVDALAPYVRDAA
jgi:peptidoglycan/LPS O-acetylase OafA/YrhL